MHHLSNLYKDVIVITNNRFLIIITELVKLTVTYTYMGFANPPFQNKLAMAVK